MGAPDPFDPLPFLHRRALPLEQPLYSNRAGV
jgi:hypothetical protein